MVDSDIITPSWLDKEFLTTILQKEEPSKQIKVLSFSVKSAVPKGNNYACLVVRVNVVYEADNESRHTSFIIKTPYTNSETANVLDAMGITDKEYLIYEKLLPIMNEMTKKSITPKKFFCSLPKTIIMEDLSESGYVMCDKLEQLDFDHCNCYMKVLAKFHAVSFYIHKQDPELIEQCGKEVFFCKNYPPEFKEMFFKGIRSFAIVLDEWKGFEKFSKFMRNNENKIFDKICEIHNGKKHLRVLNHGDSWTNNILFKHDESGKVVDIKIIDLQVCRFASPAIDLVTFLTSCAREDVKERRLPELYATYLDSFNSTLKDVGCEEMLTEEQLQDELKFAEPLVLNLLSLYIALVLSEKNNDMDLGVVLEAWSSFDGELKDPMRRLLNGEHYKKVAKYTLKKLEEQDILKSF